MRTAAPVDRKLLERALVEVEASPVPNLSALWKSVADRYLALNPEITPISASLVMARVKEWELPVKTQPGKIGRQPSTAPKEPKEPKVINTYSEGGQGRKKCICDKYVGLRVTTCPACGYVFQPKEEQAPVETVPEGNFEEHKKAMAILNFIDSSTLYTFSVMGQREGKHIVQLKHPERKTYEDALSSGQMATYDEVLVSHPELRKIPISHRTAGRVYGPVAK